MSWHSQSSNFWNCKVDLRLLYCVSVRFQNRCFGDTGLFQPTKPWEVLSKKRDDRLQCVLATSANSFLQRVTTDSNRFVETIKTASSFCSFPGALMICWKSNCTDKNSYNELPSRGTIPTLQKGQILKKVPVGMGNMVDSFPGRLPVNSQVETPWWFPTVQDKAKSPKTFYTR